MASNIFNYVDNVYMSSDTWRRNKHIFELHNDGYTMDEIGFIYGISRQRVQQIIVKVMRHAKFTDDPESWPFCTALKCALAERGVSNLSELLTVQPTDIMNYRGVGIMKVMELSRFQQHIKLNGEHDVCLQNTNRNY